MTKVIKFPRRHSADNMEKEFEQFLDDFGGFVYSMKAATHSSWDQLAERCDLSPATLFKLANREYVRGPTLSTFYKIIRALDDRGLIRHSTYERWRGFDRAAAKQLDRKLATAAE